MNGLFKANPRFKLIRLSLLHGAYDKLPLDLNRLRAIGEALELPSAEINEILSTDHSHDLKRVSTPVINAWCLDMIFSETSASISYKYCVNMVNECGMSVTDLDQAIKRAAVKREREIGSHMITRIIN